uniref:hypothetical protein n=1 Tax=Mesorhizobium sp. 113-1-2 TaxID=2744515 RepID=UPI001FD30672|nr:hypothetical protein [Mesorhizobium sp. 113-1-2]
MTSVPAALKPLEDVVLLPHLGSATEEMRVAIGMKVVVNPTAFFEGRPVADRLARQPAPPSIQGAAIAAIDADRSGKQFGTEQRHQLS